MTGNAKMRTAGGWLLILAATSAFGCTVYEPSLLPAGAVDAGRPDAHRLDAGSAPDADASSVSPTDGASDVSSDAPEESSDASDAETSDGPRDAPVEAAPSCDAACLVRCGDRIMNGNETRIDCGGDCPEETCPPAPAITSLVVNDMNNGQDGIVNMLQWSLGTSFADDPPLYADRTYTLAPLIPEAAHLAGKPWIRTTVDSKLYSGMTPPVATAMVSGSFVYIANDDRQGPDAMMADGYEYQFYKLTVLEGTTPRAYGVWRKPIVSSPMLVAFPSVTSVASFYLIVVE